MIEVHLQEVSITHMGFALLLRPAKSQRVVPIFIGPLETYSISSVLEQKSSERPLTHDLTRDMLILTNHSIEKVHVDDFREGIFYAHIFLKDDRESGIIKEIESRPSDAIALALRFKAPIFIAEKVFDETSVDISMVQSTGAEELEKIENLEQELEELQEELSEDEDLLTKEDVLKKMLATAIAKEDYEEAARLRDELKRRGID